MTKYIFKPDEVLAIKAASKADPDKIGQELEAIAAKAGGHLTPIAIVDAARDRKSVLHKHFEWDDAAAAEAYRLDQARSLVRCIHVENVDAMLAHLCRFARRAAQAIGRFPMCLGVPIFRRECWPKPRRC